MNALAVFTGGHVRTGLEDNPTLDAERTRPATNEGLVARVAELARDRRPPARDAGRGARAARADAAACACAQLSTPAYDRAIRPAGEEEQP